MKNKGFVIVLTTIITLICLYYLSFTLISRGVQHDAVAYATDSKGNINLEKKQKYIDSVWNKPVYNFLGMAEFTYKEVKNNEISLGLDLQGGMHVTLEVSPIDIIKGLSGYSQDSAFLKALNKASVQKRNSQERFSTLFFDAYREANPGKRLAPLFATASTRGRISLTDSDEEVMDVVNEEIESAIDRSLTILTNRIDQFGTTSPNIQRLWPGSRRKKPRRLLPPTRNRNHSKTRCRKVNRQILFRSLKKRSKARLPTQRGTDWILFKISTYLHSSL